MKKLPYNGRDKNRVQGGLVWDAKSGTYVETGGLAEGERIGGRWGYKYLGYTIQMKKLQKLRSTPRFPVLR